MKKIFKHTIFAFLSVCIFASFLVSCNDFVDVVPKGNTIPSTVEDLAKLMNNGSFAINGDEYEFNGISAGTFYLEVLSDDYTVSQDPNDALYATYAAMPFIQNEMTWADNIFGSAESDNTWDNIYHSTYIANYVLENIDKVEESASISRDEVKARALTFRAMNYFLLGGLYGKQYVASTASTDLSVPLILEPDVNAQQPRATVKEVYDQMLSDLTEAIKIFKTDTPQYNGTPSRAAAYALRARVYLWMQDYDKAYADACASYNLKSDIIDYNTVSLLLPGYTFYGLAGYDSNIETNSEILWERYVSEHCMCEYTDKLKSIVDKDNDLRWRFFISSIPMYGYLSDYCWNKKLHSGIDVSEVLLMKAETALRKSSANMSEALEALNTLRKLRYDAATYTDFSTTDSKTLLTEILNERRREIIFNEMSFLDKKRLSADPSTAQPMERTYNGKTYTVPVGDSHWQMPIPLNVQQVNPLLK